MAPPKSRRALLPFSNAFHVGARVTGTVTLQQGMVMLHDPRNMEYVCQV